MEDSPREGRGDVDVRDIFSEFDISKEEIIYIYDRVYKMYVELLQKEHSDITTFEYQKFRKVLDKRGFRIKAKSGNRDLILKPIRLFHVFGFHELRDRIIEELPVPKDPNLIKARRGIRDRGLIPHVFENAKLDEVLDALVGKVKVEGINILEKIKDSNFRFITTDQPLLSVKMSEALHTIYKEAKTVTPQIQQRGTKKLKENADDFAKNMYEIVKNIQMEKKVSSYRETVKALNENHVPSYRGGEWHVNTLQQLQKRWKALGLILNGPNIE